MVSVQNAMAENVIPKKNNRYRVLNGNLPDLEPFLFLPPTFLEIVTSNLIKNIIIMCKYSHIVQEMEIFM